MKSKKSLYIGLFIVFLMVTSTLGFIIGDDTQERREGDFVFVNGWWILNKGEFEYKFSYLPEDVGEYGNLIFSNDVYLYVENTSLPQLNRLSYFFATNSVKYSILEEKECDLNKLVLVIRKGLDKIYKEDKCLILEGDIDKSIDKIGYRLVLDDD